MAAGQTPTGSGRESGGRLSLSGTYLSAAGGFRKCWSYDALHEGGCHLCHIVPFFRDLLRENS